MALTGCDVVAVGAVSGVSGGVARDVVLVIPTPGFSPVFFFLLTIAGL